MVKGNFINEKQLIHPMVFLKRESRAGKYYWVLRTKPKGQIISYRRYKKTFPKQSAIKLAKQNNTLREDIKRVILPSQTIQISRKDKIIPKSATGVNNKPYYQYYFTISYRGQTLTRRSGRVPAGFPTAQVKEEAFGRAVEAMALQSKIEVSYEKVDADTTDKIINSKTFKIVDQGVVYYIQKTKKNKAE